MCGRRWGCSTVSASHGRDRGAVAPEGKAPAPQCGKGVRPWAERRDAPKDRA